MKTTLSALLLLVVAAPVLAASPAGLQPDSVPIVEPEESEEPAPLDNACTWALSDTESMLEAVVPQSDVGAASGCSASTQCASGTISCTGYNFCFSEPHCFVYCDGYTRYCDNPCP